MRILVLQLARFGDLYQTWPCLSALRRKHPGAEMHLVVREGFAAAAPAAGWTVHRLPVAEILTPALKSGDVAASHARLGEFLAPLTELVFSEVINLSFSPASSYMTDLLAGDALVRGYTRQVDGFLSIPDDSSAYFYGQVGIGRANRWHLTDVFAAVAGVDLGDEDFDFAPAAKITRARVVVQLGASQAEKTYPGELWSAALRALAQNFGGEIVLVGSRAERGLAEAVASGNSSLINQVGETSLSDLFEVIAGARLVIAADSAPIHIAGLTATPVLNLSAACVNFWETGPRSVGSRVLWAPRMENLTPERVAAEAIAMLAGQGPAGPCYVREAAGFVAHEFALSADAEFRWALLQAIYTGTDYPEAVSETDLLAFQRLFELSELALMELERWADPPLRAAAGLILAEVDQLLGEVERLSPSVAPLVRWFETERSRMGPDSPEATLARTQKLFADLQLVCRVYRRYGSASEERARAIELCETCVPAMREYDFAMVEDSFQQLVATLHELARAPGELGTAGARPGAGAGAPGSAGTSGPSAIRWSEVLEGLNAALKARDYIELADRLEFELKPALMA